MRQFGLRPRGADAGVQEGEAVRPGTARGVTAAVSAAALLVSLFSLWETSLKTAQLDVYVTDAISYGLDLSGGYTVYEAGGYEVLAVPITIANRGARDGAILALSLDIDGAEGEAPTRFEAAYTADAAYFAATDDLTTGETRPKTPFAPLVVAGRSAWSGTVLFYPPELSARKVVTPGGRIQAKLAATTPSTGWLGGKVAPIPLAFDVPQLEQVYLQEGALARLRRSRGP